MQCNAATLTNRLIGAVNGVKRLQSLPHTYEDKEHVIRTATLPFGLYGCEGAHANETYVGKLTTGISNATGPRSALHANTVRCNLKGPKETTDPELNIWQRRVVLLRRMVARRI